MPPTEQAISVTAIVAAYNPPESLVETVALLRQQVQQVVVVDDGSRPDAMSVLDRLSAEGATIVRQGSNSGIAAALNAGLRAANDLGAPGFYLTLDQDSRIGNHYVDRALATLDAATRSGFDTGFICAASYSGHPVPVLAVKGDYIEAFDPMQSGFLIPRSTIERVGPFDENLFIDGVDSEFTMRIRAAGMSVLVGQDCDIEHDLGQRRPGTLFGIPVKALGREISYNYHSPSRVYYICRNGTVLSRRYWRRYPRWVALRLLEESKAHLLRFAFSPGRGKLLHAAAAGFADGFRGRTGRIPEKLEHSIR
ncbi:glycosyltransferase [Arthrobacter sp. CJ23]|uniref:glycosyltransferase n=1 Tax=Arthrobacter sp. CJ23 TaxID=2972479 RepID=UPI00215D20B2|nr:glycosyltransferase [Arthrobacter sp. CJ23]UVJ38307.1 glycosyltransferase [Arthrobacter sp. CJ23]